MDYIIMAIAITILVPIAITLYYKWALSRASLNKPRIDPEGNTVLYHGIPLFSLAFGFFAISAFIMIIPLITPHTQPFKLVGWLLFSIFALAILIPGILIVLEGLKAQVIITEKGILARAPWPWYPKTVPWKSIERISYSPLSSSIVVDYKKHNTLRISPFFYGIAAFCQNLEKHLGPEKYEEADKFIHNIYKLSNRETNTAG